MWSVPLYVGSQPWSAVIINKSDLVQQTSDAAIAALRPGIRCLTVSALDRESLRPILNFFREYAEICDRMTITQPRHLDAVKRAVSFLREACDTLNNLTPDMAAVDLQAAQNAFSEITGDRADEKLLDSYTRRDRTHRLCTRAGMLENFLRDPEALSNDQVMTLLRTAFQQEPVQQAL